MRTATIVTLVGAAVCAATTAAAARFAVIAVEPGPAERLVASVIQGASGAPDVSFVAASALEKKVRELRWSQPACVGDERCLATAFAAIADRVAVVRVIPLPSAALALDLRLLDATGTLRSRRSTIVAAGETPEQAAFHLAQELVRSEGLPSPYLSVNRPSVRDENESPPGPPIPAAPSTESFSPAPAAIVPLAPVTGAPAAPAFESPFVPAPSPVVPPGSEMDLSYAPPPAATVAPPAHPLSPRLPAPIPVATDESRPPSPDDASLVVAPVPPGVTLKLSDLWSKSNLLVVPGRAINVPPGGYLLTAEGPDFFAHEEFVVLSAGKTTDVSVSMAAPIVCLRCRYPNLPGTGYCENCGEPLRDTGTRSR